MISQKQLAHMLAANDELQLVGEGGRAGRSPRCTVQGEWTETEKAFAREYLQPRLERGEYVWYMAQVAVYTTGQTYTFDFVALRPEGGADHFEIKGSYKLGSESRSSVKVRWAADKIRPFPGSLNRVYWARRKVRGWHIREVVLKQDVHPIIK